MIAKVESWSTGKLKRNLLWYYLKVWGGEKYLTDNAANREALACIKLELKSRGWTV